MSIAQDQLAEINSQITGRFRSHPLISVSPSKGEPPSQYLITFRIAGFKKEVGGEVEKALEHQVELAIPFGFPHFPPSCKPRSDIFHPDFDPGAICIGDYWEANPSLPELILTLGKMINGEMYTTENAFNNEAAAYYLDHKGSFPLAELDWQEQKEDGEEEEIIEVPGKEMDPQEEILLELDEEEIYHGEKAASPLDQNIVDPHRLDQHLAKKEYYVLARLLKNNPAEDFAQIYKESSLAIDKAEGLHTKAKDLEERGKAEQALTLYREVADIAADFPGIHANILRMEQTIDLVEDLSPEAAADFALEGLEDLEDLIEKEEHTAKPRKAKTSQKKSQPSKTPSEKTGGGKKMVIASLSLFLFLLMGAGGAYYYLKTSDKALLVEAGKLYSDCKASLDASKFSQAQNSCARGLDALARIRMIRGDEIGILQKEMQTLLDSQEMQHGLAGKVLYQGKYVSKKDIAQLRAWQEHSAEAEAFYAAGKWQEAEKAFTEAITAASSLSDLSLVDLKAARVKEKESLFLHRRELAKAAYAAKDWNAALDAIELAEKALIQLPQAKEKGYQQEMSQLQIKTKLEEALIEGETALAEGNWDGAANGYLRALDLSNTLIAKEADKTELANQGVVRAKLFSTIEEGNREFGHGNWDKAIAAFKAADEILESNLFIVKQGEADLNAKRLDKIILRATIIREKQSIAESLKEGDKKRARIGHRQLIALLKDNPLAREKEFAVVIAESEKTIAELDEAIFIDEKIAYLENNFLALFEKNYPDSDPETLSALEVSLEDESSKSLLFKMQCKEKSDGRPLTLVMYYRYNKENGKWSLATGG